MRLNLVHISALIVPFFFCLFLNVCSKGKHVVCFGGAVDLLMGRAVLFVVFSVYPACSAHVRMWDGPQEEEPMLMPVLMGILIKKRKEKYILRSTNFHGVSWPTWETWKRNVPACTILSGPAGGDVPELFEWWCLVKIWSLIWLKEPKVRLVRHKYMFIFLKTHLDEGCK